MTDSPNIARIAALIGDTAHAQMLQALMSGRALTASELGAVVGVGKVTASFHLAPLVAGGLVTARPEGRHKYLSLGSAAVARTLESLMTPAAGQGAGRDEQVRTGPRDPALRHARQCYNHIAGARGVQAYDSLAARGAFAQGSGRHGSNPQRACTFLLIWRWILPPSPPTNPRFVAIVWIGASGAITLPAALAALFWPMS
jgi:DNA-binding transcriptional ArsR family regulator